MLTPLGAMQLAIDEARKGLGFVSPNPPVGCVILDQNGGFLAKGHHQRYGADHAEVDALKHVVDVSRLNKATIYVTLEPCAHEGKTPSCAKALAKLPIARVVYGLIDPNPLVAGQGIKFLEAAGIAVEKFKSEISLENELEELAEVFLRNHRLKMPFVTVKLATTLDGQMAHVSGDSQWITGEEAREHAQYLRATHDAVMVGKGTFLKDRPKLNIRHPLFEGKANKVIIVDTNAELVDRLADSPMMSVHKPENIFLAVSETRYSEKPEREKNYPFHLWALPEDGGRVDLNAVYKKAYSSGVTSILVEGGAQLISQVLAQKKSQRICQFIAPQLLGLRSGLSFTDLPFVSPTFSERVTIGNPKWLVMGKDILLSGRLD